MFQASWFTRCVQTASLAGMMTPMMAMADFVEDSHLGLGLRNFYIDRDYKGENPKNSRIGSWTQGFDLRFISGYTEGPVQFGLDASMQYAYRLDGGGGRGLTALFRTVSASRSRLPNTGAAATRPRCVTRKPS